MKWDAEVVAGGMWRLQSYRWSQYHILNVPTSFGYGQQELQTYPNIRFSTSVHHSWGASRGFRDEWTPNMARMHACGLLDGACGDVMENAGETHIRLAVLLNFPLFPSWFHVALSQSFSFNPKVLRDYGVINRPPPRYQYGTLVKWGSCPWSGSLPQPNLHAVNIFAEFQAHLLYRVPRFTSGDPGLWINCPLLREADAFGRWRNREEQKQMPAAKADWTLNSYI